MDESNNHRDSTGPANAALPKSVLALAEKFASEVNEKEKDNEVVEEGQEIAVLESMKTEVPVSAANAGTITWLVIEGQTVSAGQALAVLSS